MDLEIILGAESIKVADEKNPSYFRYLTDDIC